MNREKQVKQFEQRLCRTLKRSMSLQNREGVWGRDGSLSSSEGNGRGAGASEGYGWVSQGFREAWSGEGPRASWIFTAGVERGMV